MHVELREHLRTASGESKFVVAINIDIRGFSAFFSDSSQAAAFLSSAYTRILDDYFPTHSFFKPTGDGLLIIRNIDRESLAEAVGETVNAALRLDSGFAKICAGEHLINFRTPERVGIGLARGTATVLADEQKVLDYSGYPLNLCSRLMDLARPHGVVFDETFDGGIIETDTRQMFSAESVWIKGLAETDPMTVCVTESVLIPTANRHPFGGKLHYTHKETVQVRSIRARAPSYQQPLDLVPLDPLSVNIHFLFPKADKSGRPIAGLSRSITLKPIEVSEGRDGPRALVDYGSFVKSLEQYGARSTWPVQVWASFMVPIDAPGDGA
jgi:hypothetical protein